LTLIQLYHRLGEEETAQRLVEELLRDSPKDIKLLNSLGNFYITHLIRVRSALTFFEESLELNPNQENVQMMVIRLRENYLDRLIDVWPDEEAKSEGFLP
jgi:tetratricopeptide (TPR) repeat protein